MKRIALTLILALLPCWLLSAAGELPKPQSFKLANGLTVFFLGDTELPLVSFRLLVGGAGTSDDPSEGVAGMTARLLLKGTTTLTAEKMAEELDFLGAALWTNAQEEYTEMAGNALKENFPRLLSLAADCLATPAFAAEEFEKERKRRLEEIRAVKDSPAQAVRFYFRKAYFSGHPFGKLGSGTQSRLEKMAVDDVRLFYRKYLRPDQAVLAVVGDIDASRLKKLLSGTMAKWENPPVAATSRKIADFPHPRGKNCLLVDKPDATQAYFILGVPGMASSDPGTAAAQVMNTLFGGRFTSWVNTELRIKRGLTYGARSSFESWKPAGIFTVSSYTKNDKIGEMLEITFGLVEKARKEGFSASEIESARNYILGQFPPTLEGLLAKARAYTNLHFLGLGFNYYSKLLAQIGKTGTVEANSLARRIMPEGDYVLVVVGKAADIRQQLAKVGEFKEKKITDPDF